MKRFLPIVVALFLVVSCSKTPYTDRRQFMLMSTEQENDLGAQAYQEILAKTKESSNQEQRARIVEIGKRIAAASERPDYKWEFKLLESKDVNAFCLPGGKVAFYEGIMPICDTDDGIAVVMGHEVAHALARHGGERMSQSMGTQLVGTVLATGLGGADPVVRDSVLQAYGLGSQVGLLLPWGRKQESEADKIGLILMAKAGYDPRTAVAFWKRMSAQSKGSKPPEFLSTHPSDETRIKQIEAWMPEIKQHYKPR